MFPAGSAVPAPTGAACASCIQPQLRHYWLIGRRQGSGRCVVGCGIGERQGKSLLIRSRVALLTATSALAVAAAGSSAQAQWNLYQPYTSSAFVPFVSAIGPEQDARVNVAVGDMASPQPIIMDTGSIGLQVSPDRWNPGNLAPIGAGSITLNSSGITNSGYFYNAPVNFFGNGAGGKNVATANVPVLVVTQTCKAGICIPTSSANSVFYMGVGLDRTQGESLVTPNPELVNGTTLNPFLNVTRIGGQAVARGSLRQGYIVDGATSAIALAGGVTLGLTQQDTRGFSFVKLTPNTSTKLDPWNAAPVSSTITNASGQAELYSSGATPPLGGGVLPDAGIDYMFLHPTPGNLTTVACTLSTVPRNCAPDGTQIQVSLPGNGIASPLAQYGFTVGSVPASNVQPADVAVLDGAPYVNTGRQFFLGFYYLYDPQGGFVGYAATPGLGSSGSVNPGIALIGAVALPNRFTDSLPLYLIGDTVLQQTGSGSIGASVSGSGKNLAVAGGSIAFNGAIDMSGGSFFVQRDALATINGSLTAAGISIASQGALANNSRIAATVLNGGRLTNNGSITGDVTNSGLLDGNGRFAGNLANSGVIAPGISIGTVTVAGNAALAAGTTYNAEVNAQGQSDLIAVGGTTAIQGGTVAVLPQNGAYAPRTSYTILSSTGGVSGSFASVSSSSPFLLPALSYTADDVVLTLTIGGFRAAAQNPVQAAVGGALDSSVLQASGDYAEVLGDLARASPTQVPALLTSLSGMNYSGFANSMVQTAQLFMSNFSDMAGGTARGQHKVALAAACEVACDITEPAPWTAWGGGLGGLGTVGAGAGLGGVTYNVAGFAGGLDRHLADSFLAGVTVGYATGSQWVSGFSGQGFSNTVQAGLYGSFLQGPIYLDGIVGYAYSGNQLSRSINIPGMAGRTAHGQTRANQVFGQGEGGWRVELGGHADAYITPFARLQAYTGTQGAFTESGAQSLSLRVAAQTTRSLRTVLGAQIGGAIDLGWRDKLAAQLRIGWSHEYADTSRPVAVSFVGAPGAPFTTYGVSPTRDGAVVGFSASTALADAVSIYARYEGNVAGQDSSHAFNAGVRFAW